MAGITKEYRIPKEEEFVQDFEFEVASDHKYGFLDFSAESVGFEEIESYRVWSKSKVWWMNEPTKVITSKKGDIEISCLGSFINFFKPFNVKSFIEQGLIRVKI